MHLSQAQLEGAQKAEKDAVRLCEQERARLRSEHERLEGMQTTLRIESEQSRQCVRVRVTT